jgi:multiple sugar transport system ATP-binding protein
VGVRPEHFEDARFAPSEAPGLRFRATVAVVESMGAEEYVFFDVAGQAEAPDLRELAADAGLDDLPSHGGAQEVVARVDGASEARAGAELELLLDTSHIKLFDTTTGAALTPHAS